MPMALLEDLDNIAGRDFRCTHLLDCRGNFHAGLLSHRFWIAHIARNRHLCYANLVCDILQCRSCFYSVEP